VPLRLALADSSLVRLSRLGFARDLFRLDQSLFFPKIGKERFVVLPKFGSDVDRKSVCRLTEIRFRRSKQNSQLGLRAGRKKGLAWPKNIARILHKYARNFLLCSAAMRRQNQSARRQLSVNVRKLVLPDRIELSTSPLPMECSTTELRQRAGIGNRPLGPPQAGGSCHKDPSGASMRRGPEWAKMGKK
jgi:hypothetical protein